MEVFALKFSWKETASHAGLSFLLALGLMLTLLGVTGLTAYVPMAALMLTVLTVVLAAASADRRIAIAAGCAFAFVAAVWLVVGGAGDTVEVVQALILHLSGQTAALPLVAEPFTVLACALCAATAWFVTYRSAGPYPALALLLLVLLLLWLGDQPGMLVCLLPAALACVTLLLRAGDDATTTLHVLPLAAVVTALGFVGAAVGGATYEPLHSFAEELRQRIYDTFFFTAPRDVFTLASEGYYPQGQGQLGGPAEPDTDPVMVVTAPGKTYLRGVIKNVYTGRTWVDDIGGRRYLWTASRYAELRGTLFDESLPADTSSPLLTEYSITVRMLGASASSMFVPQRVRSLETEGSLVAYFNDASEIFTTENLALGDVWRVKAPLFTAAHAETETLVNAAAAADDPAWEDVQAAYLQLPDHLGGELYAIAREVTAGAETPYAAAIALRNYIARSCTYTMDAPEQDPQLDFVSTFLLLEKRGYCTHFASALTVLCRMAGLPARYVEGYVATPDATGIAIVTGEQGHAWTEVYFRGFGWVTFDATPLSVDVSALPPEDDSSGSDEQQDEPSPSSEPTPSASPAPTDAPTPAPSEESSPAPTDSPEPDETPLPTDASEESPEPDENDGKQPAGPFPWLTLLILLLALLAAARVALVQPGVRARMCRRESERWLVWAQASHDALRTCGLKREKHESPRAFFARVDESRRFGVSLAPLGEAESLMFYGHAIPLAEDTQQTCEAFRAVWRRLNAAQRLRFQLERIFLPRTFHDLRK